jgi:hypothetical protein
MGYCLSCDHRSRQEEIHTRRRGIRRHCVLAVHEAWIGVLLCVKAILSWRKARSVLIVSRLHGSDGKSVVRVSP